MFRRAFFAVGRRACTCPYTRAIAPASVAALSGACRWTTTTATGANSASRPSQQRRPPQQVLPPAFDVVHWNETDISKGHLLRVIHRDSYVLLDYYTQSGIVTPATPRANRAQRTVSVALPPVYVARLLSVLEGKSKHADIQLRLTTAAFEANEAAGPHHFVLRCSTSQQSQAEQQPNTTEWEVPFDPAEALMLHRFLSQCLQYNTGFCRPNLTSAAS